MKKIAVFCLALVLCMVLTAALCACGGDTGNTPGGDTGNTPGGDTGNTPGGDNSQSGGDNTGDVTPGGDNTPGGGTQGDDPTAHVHTEVVDEAVSPTCTETGLSEGKHCSVCNEVIVKQQTLPVLEHDWDEPTYVWADDYSTCTASRVCKRNASHIESEVARAEMVVSVEASAGGMGEGHYTVHFENAAFASAPLSPTFAVSADGNAYREQSDYAWADGDAEDMLVCTVTKVCVNDPSKTITETGTVTLETITPATCLANGAVRYVATFKNPAFETQYSPVVTIPATGHKPSDWIIDTPATCTTVGAKHIECTVCREVLERDIINSAHTIKTLEAVNSTCTETGLTEGKRCTVCGETLVEQRVVPARGHNYQNDICTICGAPEYSKGLEYTLNDTGTEYSVTGIGTCTDADIVIPATYQGLPVTSIGALAFRFHKRITSVHIPQSVTIIGNEAFLGCTALNSVTFEENSNLTKIDSYAFSGCFALTSITLPSSVTSLGLRSFSACYNLTSIVIPSSLTTTDSSFLDCYSLVEVYNMSSLNITAGKDYGSVGYYALNVYTPTSGEKKTFTDENGYVFYEDGDTCYLVRYVGNQTVLTLPESCHGKNYDVYSYAFYFTDIVSVTIPSSVTSIGYRSFCACYNLTSVVIPSSVTIIESSAFISCEKLVEVYNMSSLDITKGSDGNGYAGYYALNIYTPTRGVKKTFTDESGYVFYEDGDTRYLLGYTGTKTELMLPESCNGKDYAIYKYAFYSDSDITGITLPSSVTSIGNFAFYNCVSLTSITIPSSVTSIGGQVFYNCSGLTSVKFDENSRLTSIGVQAFFNCYRLISITIPSSVTSIGNDVFGDCKRLTSVNFGENSQVTSIGVEAFRNCSALTSIAIPSAVTSIGSQAFRNCSALTSIAIPSAVTSIGSQAFYNCVSLTNITIPSSVTSIGDNAFQNCNKLAEVYNLSSLNVTKGSTGNGYLGYYALNIYTSADTPSKQFTDENGYVFDNDGDGYYLIGYVGTQTELTLPESCKGTDYAVYKYAFYNHSGITSVTIPSSVTNIGDYAFYGCKGITSVTFGADSQVTSIGAYAFYNCSGLTSITIPSSVTNIGSNAFRGCGSLISVKFGENSQLTNIGEYVFYDCVSLTSVTIPSPVTSIGDNAFQNCYKLVEVYNLSSLNFIKGSGENGYIVRYALDIYTSADTPSKQFTDENGYMFYEDGDTCYLLGYVGSQTELTLPESCNGKNYAIYQYAFYKYSGITSVAIPSSVTSIGNYAFYDCSGLTSITIPSSVTNIGSNAFSGCRSLKSVEFGENSKLMTIGTDAFYGCSGLTSITIPASVTSISKYAFSNCTKLKSVTFENTNGWYVASSSTAMSGTTVNASNAETNAYNLVSSYNYSGKYWKRK